MIKEDWTRLNRICEVWVKVLNLLLRCIFVDGILCLATPSWAWFYTDQLTIFRIYYRGLRGYKTSHRPPRATLLREGKDTYVPLIDPTCSRYRQAWVRTFVIWTGLSTAANFRYIWFSSPDSVSITNPHIPIAQFFSILFPFGHPMPHFILH